jgi:prepilin-type N-terminal cleavage/methylation domain-containing protein
MRRYISTERSSRGPRRKRIAKKNAKPPHNGFTLVELLITIFLISIIATIAIPSYSGYSSNTNLKAAARNIQSDFLDLKERAIAESTAYQITFDTSGNTYTIQKGTGTGAPYTPIEVKVLSAFGRDVGIFCAVFDGGIPTITFDGRGIATPGNVVLTNSRGSTATVAASVSGRTYVQVNNQ